MEGGFAISLSVPFNNLKMHFLFSPASRRLKSIFGY